MNFNKLKFGSTIGIIGGGQLGKMMAQSAQKMGYKVIVLDPDKSCPCQHVAHEFINADYDDQEDSKKHWNNLVSYLMSSLMNLKIYQQTN